MVLVAEIHDVRRPEDVGEARHGRFGPCGRRREHRRAVEPLDAVVRELGADALAGGEHEVTPSMIFLTGDYGNEGVAIGRLIGYFISFLSIVYVEKWFFRKFLAGFWLRLLGQLLLAAALAVLVETASVSYLTHGWLALFLSSFLGGVAYLSVLWLLGFVTEDEKLLVRKVFRA